MELYYRTKWLSRTYGKLRKKVRVYTIPRFESRKHILVYLSKWLAVASFAPPLLSCSHQKLSKVTTTLITSRSK